MSLSNHVDITITADSVGVARLGFGTPIILSHNAAFAGRAKIYQRSLDVLDDFASDDPEYLCAVAMFSQEPHPKNVIIGKMTGSVTQSYDISVASVLDSHEYSLTVQGQGFAKETVSFTSDADAANDEIVAGLVSALNNVVGNNYTASAIGSAGSQTVQVLADAAGEWLSISTTNPEELDLMQNHVAPADVTIATDIAAISVENDTWYWVCSLYNSEAYVSAVSLAIQSLKKFYVAGSCDTRDLNTSTDTEGTLDVLQAAARTRTAGFYHHVPAEFAEAALIGNLAPREAGSWTAKFKTLIGITATNLTATHRANLVARHANFYEEVATVKIVSEGTTSAGPSVLRGFIDSVVNLDWVEDDMSKTIFEGYASAAKIPRDDEGMVVLENAMQATMKRAVKRKIAKSNPPPVVSIPLVADMDDLLPRGTRGSFSFELAGAGHSAKVTGVVTQ